MTTSELTTVLTVGLSGAASLFTLGDMDLWMNGDGLQGHGFEFHLELVAVMSVVSAVAVSKLLLPETIDLGRRKVGRRPEQDLDSKPRQELETSTALSGLDYAFRLEPYYGSFN